MTNHSLVQAQFRRFCTPIPQTTESGHRWYGCRSECSAPQVVSGSLLACVASRQSRSEGHRGEGCLRLPRNKSVFGRKIEKKALSLLFPSRLSAGFLSQQSCSRDGSQSRWLFPGASASEILPAFSCCPGPLKIGWPLLTPRASFLELAWVMFAEHPLILKLPVPVEG